MLTARRASNAKGGGEGGSKLAGQEALRHGITTFHDQGTNFADIDRLKALAEGGGGGGGAGRLPVRLHVAVRHETNQALRERVADYRLIDHGDGFLDRSRHSSGQY